MVARCCASPPGVYILLPGISSLLEDSVVLIHATNEFVFFPIFLKYEKKNLDLICAHNGSVTHMFVIYSIQHLKNNMTGV